MRTLTQSQDVVTRTIAGETLLVPIRSGVADLDSIFALNETGSFVWQAIDGSKTVEEIAAAMAEQFEVSPDDAARDVAELVGSMIESGLVLDGTAGN